MNAPLRLSAVDASGTFPMDPFASVCMIPFLSPKLNLYFLSDTIASIYIQLQIFISIYITEIWLLTTVSLALSEHN